MKNLILKLKNLILSHKIRSLVVLVVVVLSGYYGFQKLNPDKTITQYSTEAAVNSTITVSVSSSGQVSNLNSIELKPAAGTNNVTITKTNVKVGDAVKAGQVIAIIDQKNAASSLRQAQASVASARASYDKLIAGATKLDLGISERSVTQAEQNYNNAVTSAELTKKTVADSLEQAERELADITAIDPADTKRDAVLSVIQDKLNSAKTTLDSEKKILTDDEAKDVLGAMNRSYLSSAQTAYDQSFPLLEKAYQTYNIADTYKSDANIKQAVEDAKNVINKVSYSMTNLYSALQNTPASTQFSQTEIDSYKTTANNGATAMNTGVTNIHSTWQSLQDAITNAVDGLESAKLSAESQLNSAENQIRSAKNSWQTAKDNLAKLQEPADAQEIASAKNQITSALVQLEQAQNTYENTIITAPFDGVVAKFDVQKGDQVSASTIIGTIITKNKIAVVSFNEVDAAKIKVGDKVILTFDAIDGLDMTGKVAEIDSIGTVSQGVVTYSAKISFDTQDERVKTNMSVNTEVITDVKADVLSVPSSAIKTDNSGSVYVELLDSKGLPYKVNVTVGIANDTLTEILDGLKEGEKVVTQAITTGGAKNTTQSNNIRIPGFGGGGRPD